MLGFNQLSLRRGRLLLFEDVTFQLHAGNRLGLVGANGSGKSSLFAMVLGQLEPDEGVLSINPADRLSHVAQESPSGPGSALDYVVDGDRELRSVQAAITKTEQAGHAQGIDLLYEQLDRLDGFTADARAARLLHGLGFAEDSHRTPVQEFSGGWRMRLNLARALMCPSEILLLDEPTNHLDLPAILWLERWLKQYEGILMVASHDRDFLDGVCNHVAHIENHQIRLYTGNYSQFEERRSEQLAQQQALFKRQQKEISHIQSYVDRFRYKASKARQAQSRLKMLERMTRIAPAHVDSPFRFHFMQPDRQPQHLVKLEQAVAGYAEPVLSHVDMLISAGDRIGLLGVNGAGKSTLVKALCDGSTLLSGERTLSRETKIGYFAQHQLDLLEPDQSPYDHLRAIARDARESELRKFLGSFGFSGERIFDPVAPFSGGEKARLVLALMIRQKPNLLLLDEPTNHLDLEMRQALSRALVDYSGALVVISHDRHLLRSVCDELWIIKDGTVGRFEYSLDEYPAWLREQQVRGSAATAERAESTRAEPVSRKAQRQREAQQRLLLKPLRDRVRTIEKQLENQRRKLLEIEQLMTDVTLYSDPERKEEMNSLTQQRTELKATLETLEWSWLEASEALEQASAED
ncbi:MAG: ATP-binding cassette domain-containing protein [Xanthomonadales bacterium]|jgi:ATP-binding cassette subfamily F protein 3|nr:ATP-binding cassette domain-containing protein [Xanthomonadales bacterium]MDH3999893.1 ATP-binding cassette domain-containing protein [Xanthomonadales bacterium]